MSSLGAKSSVPFGFPLNVLVLGCLAGSCRHNLLGSQVFPGLLWLRLASVKSFPLILIPALQILPAMRNLQSPRSEKKPDLLAVVQVGLVPALQSELRPAEICR